MSQAAQLRRAVFRIVSGPDSGREVKVHFNPESLQFTISNTLSKIGRGDSAKQYVGQSTGKLTMDLAFDTTTTGEDVRLHTEKIANFMKPREAEKSRDRTPPVVSFEWGTFKFQGMAESYRETIDFFAPSGVPLRATVNLTLASQDTVFPEREGDSQFDPRGSLEVPTRPEGGGAAEIAAQGRNPRAARGVAAANREESLRFSTRGSLALSESVSLSPPVGFATAGVVGAGGAAAGAQVSAGVAASAGAFAGLRARTRPRGSASLDLSRFERSAESMGLATDTGASFSLGGRASVEGSTSMRADVGISASLRSRIRFEES